MLFRSDEINHNPYELAAYLTVKFEDYTRDEVQASLEYFAEFFAYWCSGNTRTLAQLKELTPKTYAYFEGLSTAGLS